MEVTIESEEFEYKNLLAILVATVNSTGLKHVYNNYKIKPSLKFLGELSKAGTLLNGVRMADSCREERNSTDKNYKYYLRCYELFILLCCTSN